MGLSILLESGEFHGSVFQASFAEFVEAKALLGALIWARNQGWKEVKIFTDCLSLVAACNSPDYSHYLITSIILDIVALLKNFFSYCVICKVNRVAVSPAYNVAVAYLRNAV